MTAPTISGSVADQPASDLAPIDPFANVMISDQITPVEDVTVTVTMSNPADGTFSDLGNGSYDATTGTYTATVNDQGLTPTNELDVDLNSLAFTPAGGLAPVDQSVTTGFTIAVTDTAGGSATDSTTSVIATTVDLQTLATSDVGQNGLTSDGLFMDSAGNLFGVTDEGGTSGDGTVFEVANTSTGYAGTPTTIADFNGADGSYPYGNLIADSAGDLFGTTPGGGADSDGTVFEIVHTASGYATTPIAVASFDGTDGAQSFAGLVTDAAGDLFGTTYYGGQGFTGGDTGDGTVFEVVNTNTGYAGTPIALGSFSGGADGQNPYGGLVADAAGDLFGTTADTVFELPFANGTYAAAPITLATFAAGYGQILNGLAIDGAGDLFGTTSGINSSGQVTSGGYVFEIANTGTGYASAPSTLASFGGIEGSEPTGCLLIDAAGDLFGDTRNGGAFVSNGIDGGTLFEIANTSTGYATTPEILADLGTSGTGSTPYSGLIANAAGDLFGTTQLNSSGQDIGTAFALTGAGFVTCFRGGTRIATPSGERIVQTLAIGDDVLTASGEARAIVWIGRRHVDCRAHPAPERVWPVRIRAGAFGADLPRRDLWLSPDHAVYFAGALIPVKYLIEGVSIAQSPADRVDYYHIELTDHDILLAEGLPGESYLDTGDRFAFDNGGPAAIRAIRVAWSWETRARSPLISTGSRLREARRHIARAAQRRSARQAKPAVTAEQTANQR